MTFPIAIRAIQSRLDDVLEAYRSRKWSRIWGLFQALRSDVEAAAQVAFDEERAR